MTKGSPRGSGTAPRPMSGDERLDSILAIAERMFFERGYRGVSMRHLASEVGVQISTLYYYFPSKEEILYRIVKEYLGKLLAAATGAIESVDAGTSMTHRLQELVRRSVLSLIENRQAAGITVAGATMELPAEHQRELNNLVARYESMYVSLIREGIEKGEFVETDAPMAAYLILGAQVRLCVWYRPEGRLSPEEIANTYSFLLGRSLAVEQSEVRR